MAVVAKEDAKSFAYLDDDEDALLNEAICCSRNLEIKTDDDDEEEELKNKQKNNESQKQNTSGKAWCDINSDSSMSNLSTSNGKIDLSTSEEKIDVSTLNGQTENDSAVKISSDNAETVETIEVKAEVDSEPEKTMTVISTNDSGNSSPQRKRQREGEDNDFDETKVQRNRLNSNSSSSTMSNHSKRIIEFETDPAVLSRRQKDIDYGKNTIGYDRYTQEIPKEQRSKDHPRTPPMHMKYSRRGWDGMVKLWRKQLHYWDPIEEDEMKDEKNILDEAEDLKS